MFNNPAGNPNSQTQEKSIKRSTDLNSPYNNPCLKEHKMSLDCLEANSYNQEPCQPYFDNYNACRGFWLKVVAERRSKGIVPLLPWPEERENIKADYLRRKNSS